MRKSHDMGQNVRWPDIPWMEMSLPQGKKKVAKVWLIFWEFKAPDYKDGWSHLVLG